MNSELKTKITEYEQLAKLLEEKETTITSLQTTVGDVEARSVDLSTQLSTVSQELQLNSRKLQEAVIGLENAKSDLESEKQKAEEEKAAFSNQIQTLRETVETEATCRRVAETSIESLQLANTTLTQEHEEMKAAVDKLRLQKEEQTVKFSTELEMLKTSILSLVLDVKMKVTENVG